MSDRSPVTAGLRQALTGYKVSRLEPTSPQAVQMARRHYNLPPLTTLACFEAAARHLSFKNAAGELNVTPGAVSHQIKALENELGRVLFERKHRGVALTDDGNRLFATLEHSFSSMSRTLAELRKSGQDNSVTVASSTSVSSLWLTPRLIRFWKEHGSIAVNQHVSDNQDRPEHLIDLTIQYGGTVPPHKISTPLYRDDLVPVCGSEFAALNPATDLESLAQMSLIQLDTDPAGWATWRSWFRELGYTGEIATGMRVNNYTIALQAARDDAGVALGWRRLVQPLLDRNQLVRIGSHSLPEPAEFRIISDPEDTLAQEVRLLRNWLLDNV